MKEIKFMKNPVGPDGQSLSILNNNVEESLLTSVVTSLTNLEGRPTMIIIYIYIDD